MPDLAGYTGHNTETTVLVDGGGTLFEGWPYPDDWPYATYAEETDHYPNFRPASPQVGSWARKCHTFP